MNERIATWGEHIAREARQLVARRRPSAPWLEWAASIARRLRIVASPATRFGRVERMPRALPSVAPPEEEPGFPVPVDVRERLRELVGPGVERALLHDDEAADALARAHRADAVTVGDEVFFRRGRYRPHEERGVALLAHELTHVAAGLELGASLRRASQGGLAAEESRAALSEARALTSADAFPSTFAPPARPVLAAPAAAPAARPMRAAEDRAAPAPAAPPAKGLDVAELRRSIYQDLLASIRSDAERGG